VDFSFGMKHPIEQIPERGGDGAVIELTATGDGRGAAECGVGDQTADIQPWTIIDERAGR
jgi:hypothetical protein